MNPSILEQKLRDAGYQEPVCLPFDDKCVRVKCKERALDGGLFCAAHDPDAVPVVSRSGFRAGVLSAITGCVVLGSVFIAFGIGAGCICAAGCAGFVGGLAIAADWK
jgi:hypothetical protein